MKQDLPWQNNISIYDVRRYFHQIQHEKLPLHWLDGWLLFVLQKPSVYLISHPDQILTDEQKNRLQTGINRMQAGEPLAYLTGFQGFWQDEFLVNKHTLIPRADTERLVEVVLDKIQNQVGRLLDLGTGSGCIGISLAKQLPDWQVLLVDNSASALAVAQKNILRLAADNTQTLLSDWYDKVDGKFDVIVSNPPYIDAGDSHLSGLTAEPITALVAKNSGLFDIEQIIKQGKRYLNDGGLLAIEHGHTQADDVRRIFINSGYEHVQSFRDYGNNDRLTLAYWSGVKTDDCIK